MCINPPTCLPKKGEAVGAQQHWAELKLVSKQPELHENFQKEALIPNGEFLTFPSPSLFNPVLSHYLVPSSKPDVLYCLRFWS